ncbi:MAG TPA: M15 family metallopeptidase [Smithella sp.]|nr:M15 family metallopeptidase [Syntrophaceae bacterium]MDM7987411.1 M15 family metallopeptidase [Smithella sp.]HNY50959.1 M15 family metallopeptidase [Smithella sp.]HOG90714.1 M15 family metallopeptidase [Smithella sp.]HOU51362.1 M15 family metallopeptidase [Smithella sp.]
MFFTEEAIVDSAMSFSEAIEGTTAPDEIILTLSLVDVLYYSFDGKKHQGQMLVHQELEDDVYEIFNFIEKIFFPVGKVIPIVSYQWNDHQSMADNNSSSFNFRVIEGTAKLSMHSLGKAVDINPVQNPVIYANGVIAPDGATYLPQERGTLTADHAVVQEFLKRGWHWGGNFEQPKDYHHFEKL